MGSQKKIAQAARREARMKMKGFGDQWGQRLKVFNDALKPRPKYISRKVWHWFGSFFIDLEKIQDAFEGKD